MKLGDYGLGVFFLEGGLSTRPPAFFDSRLAIKLPATRCKWLASQWTAVGNLCHAKSHRGSSVIQSRHDIATQRLYKPMSIFSLA
jgi:hypothetical protein